MTSTGLPGFAPPPAQARPVVVLHLGGAPAVSATPTSPAVPAVAPQTLHVDAVTGDATAHPLGTMPKSGTSVTSVIADAETKASMIAAGLWQGGMSGFMQNTSTKMKAGIGVGIAAAAFVIFHKSKR